MVNDTIIIQPSRTFFKDVSAFKVQSMINYRLIAKEQ